MEAIASSQMGAEGVHGYCLLGFGYWPAGRDQQTLNCCSNKVWEGSLTALCSKHQAGFQALLATALLSSSAASGHLGRNA